MIEAKISANKLGEYLTATPTRRRQIIKDQKYPQLFKTTRYKEARALLIEHLTSESKSIDSLKSKLANLVQNKTGSVFSIQDRDLSSEAVLSFLKLVDLSKLNDYQFIAVDKFSEKYVVLGNTKVSIRPDLFLKNKNTGQINGCVKFHFPKSNQLTEKSGNYVATLLREYMEKTTTDPSSIIVSKCIALDIHSGLLSEAPKANKKRLDDLIAACEEISIRWSFI